MINAILAAGIGYVAGAFTPAVGRKIKSFFVKEADQAKAAGVKGVVNEIKSKL